MHFVCIVPFTAEMRELERIFFGTTSSDTEEIPCNENITSENNNLASDSTKETVPSPDDNKVVLSDKSEETIIPSNDKEELNNTEKEKIIPPKDNKAILNNEFEETVISPNYNEVISDE